ncbi:unnamed protein product [Tuwongella immobilis]|uniref:Uncharacterized protein n=1 Tax=Tuwongella immobilis TaxID=692036 RepID=A0A6C2YWV6_9BACT|nr:unnamed protein product [Tuwongella immobilis]VTS08134.1 unnamed protein product [Tuwongella immobilis]
MAIEKKSWDRIVAGIRGDRTTGVVEIDSQQNSEPTRPAMQLRSVPASHV